MEAASVGFVHLKWSCTLGLKLADYHGHVKTGFGQRVQVKATELVKFELFGGPPSVRHLLQEVLHTEVQGLVDFVDVGLTCHALRKIQNHGVADYKLVLALSRFLELKRHSVTVFIQSDDVDEIYSPH